MRNQPVYRRGVSWDLFDADDGGPLQLQRVDCPDDGPKMRDDVHAIVYVMGQATWEDNPDRELRDECREALEELVESWQDADTPAPDDCRPEDGEDYRTHVAEILGEEPLW